MTPFYSSESHLNCRIERLLLRWIDQFGAWRSLASATALGAVGRRFESCRPDFLFGFLLRCRRQFLWWLSGGQDQPQAFELIGIGEVNGHLTFALGVLCQNGLGA